MKFDGDVLDLLYRHTLDNLGKLGNCPALL